MPKKEQFLPALVSVFSEIGYRRATTATLAKRCETQEPVLYRLWADKKAMFVDAIDYVAENNLRIYREVLSRTQPTENPVEILLIYESAHIGEFRNHRIVFSALPEASDPAIREALQRMYHRIHAFVVESVAKSALGRGLDAAAAAWGLMGLGTIMTILDELGLMGKAEREATSLYAGGLLLGKNDSAC